MKYLLLLLVFILPAQAEEVIFTSDFEDEAAVKADWEAQGSEPGMATISTEKAASGKQSLAIVDKDSAKHAAWQTREIELPQAAIDKGQVSISWKILYSVPDGQVLRFSIFFVGGGKDDKNTKHFNLKGDSNGWSSGQFAEERYDIPIPPNSTKLRLKLASNSGRGADGEVYLDDVKVEY